MIGLLLQRKSLRAVQGIKPRKTESGLNRIARKGAASLRLRPLSQLYGTIPPFEQRSNGLIDQFEHRLDFDGRP